MVSIRGNSLDQGFVAVDNFQNSNNECKFGPPEANPELKPDPTPTSSPPTAPPDSESLELSIFELID